MPRKKKDQKADHSVNEHVHQALNCEPQKEDLCMESSSTKQSGRPVGMLTSLDALPYHDVPVKDDQLITPVTKQMDTLEEQTVASGTTYENVGKPFEPRFVWTEKPEIQEVNDKAENSSSGMSSMIKSLCLNFAPDDEIEPLVEKLLKKCSSVNDKYTIIDVLGLLEENKVRLKL